MHSSKFAHIFFHMVTYQLTYSTLTVNRAHIHVHSYTAGTYSGGLVDLPELEAGRAYRLAAVKSRQGATRAPGMSSFFLRL